MRAVLFLTGLLVTAGPVMAAMRLGVNTHFDQGWPISAFAQVEAAGTQGIRDTVSWGKVEQAPGRYSFTPANSGFMDKACARNIPVLLTLTPRNKIYDAGETIYSPEGQRAFGAFALALAKRFPCIAAFEIGNEINGHALTGRMREQMPQSYIAIIEAVRASIVQAHSKIALLSGSSLSVATGFFGRLFDAGMLRVVDGVVVHPYLAVPEQLPTQLARLRRAMERTGGTKPIWASEFGFYYETPDAAPPHAIKIITLLSAAHVERADWYALLDEKYYPNMGLFAPGNHAKPAFDSFRLAAVRLLANGDARRIDAGDPMTFIYRFGDGPYVMWGADRPIRFAGQVRSWNMRGAAASTPSRLGDDPVIVEAPGGFTLGEQSVFDDSLINFGGRQWSYAVGHPNSQAQPLDWIDWNWTPYIGSKTFPNFRAMGGAVSTAKSSAEPPRLIERYTATEKRSYALAGCFESAPGKAQSVTIAAGGRTLWSGTIDGQVRTPPLNVALGAGDHVDISYQSVVPGGPQLLRRRIRVLAASHQGDALCAPRAQENG